MQEEWLYDVTIIGGGPAGLYSAFYSGLRQMKTKVIEFQPYLGGKLHVYPEKMVWDVGGMPPLPAGKLIDQLTEQALTFDPEVVLNEKVTSIKRNDAGIFELHAASGVKHYSKTIIVAVGGGILNPQKLSIEGCEKFEVANLNYTVKDMQRFKDKTVIISGGGNSAVDWANELELVAKKVYVTYRNESLKGHEASVDRLMCGGAKCFLCTSITKLVACPNQHNIERVELTNHKTNEILQLPIDEVIVNHGYEHDMNLIENSDVDIKLLDNYYIAGTPCGESSVPGLFAAGDILKHDGKVNLIAGCFQDAANAVNKAKQYVEPTAEKIGMVSSHNVLFQQRNRELSKKLV
ncbi:thioredoxin reductase (NADPH) [Terribacillus aidingensis]|uniref:Ferredoxin--NADP reductase n=1 Tax=Terribacillus aidingensis TaxID=586416 RepID=A0A285N4C9_9BACI|nr:NAD(P)/FAD-dependent oxidoreductase [Terribacillus aidingensis]SNZ02836.1 thioredoxin reductase (NADPH) [Terribacillus aidingensis]